MSITIGIPAFNQETTIAESIMSARAQNSLVCVRSDIEILIIDDASTDNTVKIINRFYDNRIRLIQHSKNLGIATTLVELMENARGDYIVYLCGDDLFADNYVCESIIAAFKLDPKVGVIDRDYYQFIDGTNKICALISEKNVYQSACQPSGMAFRKDVTCKIKPCNYIFCEMPLIVDQYLGDWHVYKMSEPTIMARIHKNNTATKSSYYKGQSPTRNWVGMVGKRFRFPEGFIQLKNRAPKLLWREIWITWKLIPKAWLDWKYWFCAIVAIVTPRWLLIQLSWWWRKYISTWLYAMGR